MKMIKKIAIFDFCETLVNFQTGDRFVFFAVNQLKSLTYNLRLLSFYIKKRLKFFSIKRKLLNNNYMYEKYSLLKVLKGLKKETLIDIAIKYKDNILRNSIINESISFLNKLVHKTY